MGPLAALVNVTVQMPPELRELLQRAQGGLLEVAWQDGLRTGLTWGVLLGAAVAAALIRLWRREP